MENSNYLLLDLEENSPSPLWSCIGTGGVQIDGTFLRLIRLKMQSTPWSLNINTYGVGANIDSPHGYAFVLLISIDNPIGNVSRRSELRGSSAREESEIIHCIHESGNVKPRTASSALLEDATIRIFLHNNHISLFNKITFSTYQMNINNYSASGSSVNNLYFQLKNST